MNNLNEYMEFAKGAVNELFTISEKRDITAHEFIEYANKIIDFKIEVSVEDIITLSTSEDGSIQDTAKRILYTEEMDYIIEDAEICLSLDIDAAFKIYALDNFKGSDTISYLKDSIVVMLHETELKRWAKDRVENLDKTSKTYYLDLTRLSVELLRYNILGDFKEVTMDVLKDKVRECIKILPKGVESNKIKFIQSMLSLSSIEMDVVGTINLIVREIESE